MQGSRWRQLQGGWRRRGAASCASAPTSHAAKHVLPSPPVPQDVGFLHAVRGEDHSAAALHAVHQVPQVPPAVVCMTHCFNNAWLACMHACQCDKAKPGPTHSDGAWGARTVCTAPKPQAACLHHSCKAAHLEMGSSPVVGSSRWTTCAGKQGREQQWQQCKGRAPRLWCSTRSGATQQWRALEACTHLRVAQQRNGHAQPPLHASRVGPRPHARRLCQLHVFQQASRLAGALAGGQACNRFEERAGASANCVTECGGAVNALGHSLG